MAHLSTSLAGSTALPPVVADAELIAPGAAFCDLERAYDASGSTHEAGTPEDAAADKERDRIAAEGGVLAERMCDLPCTTLAGVQAMAAALAAWNRELLKDGPAKDVGDLITSHLVGRLLELRHPDADLMAICSEFRVSEAAYSAIYDDGVVRLACMTVAVTGWRA